MYSDERGVCNKRFCVTGNLIIRKRSQSVVFKKILKRRFLLDRFVAAARKTLFHWLQQCLPIGLF